MTDQTSEGVWASVGKFATIVGLLAGLIGIWSWYRNPSSDLQATIEIGRVALPPDVTALNDAIDKAVDRDHLKSVIGESDHEITEPQMELLALDLSRSVEKILRPSPFTRLDRYKGYWYAEINNPGELPVREAVLRIPGLAMASIEKEDGAITLDPQGPAIELGSILPRQVIKVTAWQDGSSSLYSTKDISLTHAGGLGRVEVLESPGWFREKLFSLFPFLLALPFIFAVVASLVQANSRRKSKDAA